MKIAIVDLLTQTPFYDRDLAEALLPMVDDLTLYAIRFHYEKDYLDAVDITRSPGRLDYVSGLKIESRPVRRIGKLVEYILNWSYLVRQFHQLRPDIVHVQWLPLLSWTSWELSQVERLQQAGIPVVYTVHNYVPHDTSATPGARFRRTYALMDHLIVHTTMDRLRLVEESGLNPSKVSVVPLGPSFQEQAGIDRKRARAELGLSPEDLVLLMFGGIRPYKGIEEAVRAMALLIATYPRCKLIVAGPVVHVSYFKHLQDLVRELGIASHVEWCPRYIHSSNVGIYHAAADVVLFPYRGISQSAAFMTAAALGCCTLTTRVGGLAEIVHHGETGIQIESSDVETLTDGLRRCLELAPEDRRRMGFALRDHILQNNNWALAAEQTLDAYRQARAQ